MNQVQIFFSGSIVLMEDRLEINPLRADIQVLQKVVIACTDNDVLYPVYIKNTKMKITRYQSLLLNKKKKEGEKRKRKKKVKKKKKRKNFVMF